MKKWKFCILIVLIVLLWMVLPVAAVMNPVTATVSSSTVLQGEKIFINGTAQGRPNSVAIWMFSEPYSNNYQLIEFAGRTTKTVNSDGSFSYELKSLHSGQYFVVVQHPMMDGIYDIDLSATDPQYVVDYAAPGGAINLFRIYGPGSLQGSDAAEALVVGIGQPYIDDTCINLQFQIESPITPSTIAIFRPSTGYWYFDENLDGIVDKSFRFGGSTDQIITGDWFGTGRVGIAIFRPSTGYWYFDYDLDGIVDKSFRYGGSGDTIQSGDWDGDGKDGIAIFRPSTGYWYFDYNLDGIVDKSFRYGGSADRTIVGKWIHF